jgi:hypothetical protein
VSAHRKLSTEGWQRLEQIAEAKLAIPDYETVAPELGISANYARNIVSQIMQSKRKGLPVPRETRRTSRLTDEEFDQLVRGC